MPLPLDLLKTRIRNEIEICQRELRHHLTLSDPTVSSFPLSISVHMLRVPGPSWEGNKVVNRFVHKFSIIIGEDYPLERPIVKWQTPVFHPNIMPPEDGGYVCTKLLENWGFDSSLASFIKGIEWLVSNPNPGNPFGCDPCTRAAAYFNRHAYFPPTFVDRSDRRIKIIGVEDGEA
jgi:ubiquitin-conjugating enzyme E2 C